MKKIVLFTLTLLWVNLAQGQIVSDTLRYNRGDYSVQAVFPVNINSQSTCADTMGLSIPSGNWISSIEVSYTVETSAGFGGSAPEDIGTYIEFESESSKESALSYGVSSTNGATETVTRTINEFNGAVTDSFLIFKIHALRNSFGNSNCDTNNARLVDSTLVLVVNHYPAPTCFQPTNLSVDWTMGSKASLSWVSGGSSDWEIEYGTPGFTPGTGTRVAAATNPFVVTGLSASTTYEFIVRDSCGSGDVSLWSTSVTDTTLCAPVVYTASYVENFNTTTTWVPGTGFNNVGSAVDACWERNPNGPSGAGGYAFGVGSDSTGTPGTGPSAGRGGSGQYLYAEASGAQNQSVAQITSPLIDVTSLTVPELNFYYHMYGDQVNQLKTEVWSQSLGWQTVGTLIGEVQTSETDTFLLATYTLSQFANDTILVRFSASRGFGTDNQGDIAIDDFTFDEAPTCPDPSLLAVKGRTMTSVLLEWQAVNATSWEIQYGATGTTLGATANTTVTVTTNPGAVTGLTSGTTYDFWIREICGPTDKSGWVGPVTGATFCTPVAAPWSENFDTTGWTAGSGTYNGGDALATCWFRSPEADTLPTSLFAWGIRSGNTLTGLTGPNDDFSGSGNYAYTEASRGAPNQEAFLESPLLDLSTLLKPRVSFYTHMRGGNINTLKLQVWVDSTQTWDTYLTVSGNQGNQWDYREVDLAGFAGDTIALRWSGTKGTGAQGDIAIDEIVLDDQPLCPDPSNFVLTDVTGSRATFNWTSGGSSTWNITVGQVGFTPSATGLTNLTTASTVVTGLAAGSSYDAYVRDTCGTLGASLWIGPLTFNTLCAPFTAPYIENFDSTSWVTGANQTPGQIDGCWQRSDTIEYFFKAGPPTNHTNNSGPSGDHTSGSGGYVFTEANTGFFGSNVFSNALTSPQIDVTTLTTPELTFWYHMYGALIDKLEVQVRGSGGSWATLSTISGSQQSASTDPWQEKIVDLSAYANDTLQIRFKGYRVQGSNNRVDISIDDVDVHEKPNCPKPSNLTATNVSSTSVDLSWTTGGSASWQISAVGSGVAAGGTLTAAATNPYTLTGLQPNTTYDIYVRDSCAAGDVSPWLGPVSISTLCGMVTAPWIEDFEGVSFDATSGALDPCYTTSASTTYFWQTGQGATPTNNTGPSVDHTTGSGKYAYIESQFAFGADGDAEFITSEIDLDTLSTPELRFWWHAAGTNLDKLEVAVESNGTWSTELTINTTSATFQSSPGDPWEEAVVDLSGYLNDTIKLRFKGFRNSTFSTNADWAIDDIEVDNAPTCFTPTAIASTASTTTSVTLSWTTGGASNWQIEYGPVGFTPGAGTIVAATANPTTVTGLTPSTYYDFYVRDSCSATDLSDWEGPFAAATACGTAVAPYLENFDNGFIGGIDNNQGHNIGATISPCWTRTDTDTNYRWGGRTGATATGGTGPGGDHTSGFGGYVYVEASFSTGTPTATLTSPEIDLSALTTPEMKFWYHMWTNNGSQGTLVWSIQDVAVGTWTVLDSVSGDQGNQWLEIVTDLSSYANKSVKIKFTATKSGGNTPQQGDIGVDDLSIDEAPTCPDPTAITATPVSNTEIEVAWTTGGATAWQIEYGPVGFTPGSGTIVSNVATNPYTIPGLTSGTTYDVYVRDSCGVGDVSMWVGPAVATPFTCVGGCTYTLELTDDFGDGWAANNAGNNFHELLVTTGTTVTSYSMNTTTGALGFSETFTINVCDGDTFYMEFQDNGQWQSECGYVLTNSNGIILSSVAGAANAGDPGEMTAGIKYQGAADCSTLCPGPVPTFTAVVNGLIVDFDATASTGTQLTYAWDFGDGNLGTGDQPSHAYTAGGSYPVALTATDSCGQSVVFNDTISLCAPLVPAVTYTQSAFDVTFDATGIADVTSATWTFGDGNSGSGLNPTHTYTGSGNFAVDVTVTNACGDQADTTLYITICVQPTATFSAKILSATGGGMQVQFDGTNSIGGNSYLWNFGDGNTNNTSNYPVHTYSVPSTAFFVTLTVFNACGDSDSYSSSIADALNVAELTLTDVQVFPNPAQSYVTISSSSAVSGSITIVDASGRTVVELEGNGDAQQRVDTEHLAAGTYVLRLVSENGFFQSRIQIVK
jgi:large repetitive protein